MSTKPTEIVEEIEVTPEMIEAGALALSRFTNWTESLEEGAARIYRTMASLDRKCG